MTAHRLRSPATDVDGIPVGGLESIGGPLGRYARPPAWATRLWPLVLLAVVPVQGALLERSWCLDHGWNSQSQFPRACFSDLPGLAQSGHLMNGLTAYVTGKATVAQPVLTGAVMALVGDLVPKGTAVQMQRGYVLWFAVLTALLLMGMVVAVAIALPRHVPLAAHVALSPVIVLAALVSSDVVGVALCTFGIAAWARRRAALAGVLLGCAVMARTYPLLVLAALVLLAVRTDRWDAVRRTILAAVATIVVVVAGFGLGSTGSVTNAYSTWWHNPAGFGSPWLVPQLISTARTGNTTMPVVRQLGTLLGVVLGHPLPVGVISGLAIAGMVAAVVAGAVLALGAPRRPTAAQVTLVMVVIVLITGKTLPVQASLWLVPLLALAGLSWRDHFIWFGCEAVHFVALWLYITSFTQPDRGLPPAWYALFLVIRLFGIAWLGWRAWRMAMARPAYVPDPTSPEDLQRDEAEDALAGGFTGAPDRLIVTVT